VPEFLNIQTLGFFTFYLVPGVIATFVYNFFIRSSLTKYADYLIELLVFGVFYHALFFWLIADVNSPDITSNQFLYNFLTLLTIFVIPSLLGYLAAFVIQSRILRRITRTATHPTPMAWEHVLGKNKPYYIIFHLKSGQKLGGLYSGESFASSFPQAQEIYVQELYHVTERGKFDNKVERTEGAIIRFDECSFIEFFTA
jgi:hypothetical protein